MTAASNVIRFPLSPTDDESNHAAAHRHVGPEFLVAPAQPNHFVQFYEEEETLFAMVGDFLATGLREGDGLVVIATPEHREGFLRRLGVGGRGALQSGQLTLLDARETMAKFMVDGAPDAARFRAMLSQVIGGAKHYGGRCLRAYGEMVDLLWQDGNPDAAIRLEELWNEAGEEHSFSLFCAYTVAHFYKEGSDAAKFFDVCRTHTHIIPTETVSRQQMLEKEIAQRKELEETLKGALLKRIAVEEELRASLEREQEARAEAERAVEFRELFVGMLGHDLRNPLNTMLNTGRILLMRNEVAPEGRARIERLIASGVRMERMINQILDLTRARLAGGFTLDQTEQDLDAIVTKIVTEVRAARPAREIVYAKSGDCCAHVDADRIEQVVSNLIGNAIAHGAPDQPVDIQLSGTEDAVHLRVRNQGKPIDPQFLPHLFDPFARSPNTKPEGRSDGLGLGLFIVDRILKAHGGAIEVSSSGETGTVFEATIPRHERPAR